jgi:hypothetical protein
MRTRLAVAVAGLGLFLMGSGASLLAHHAFAAEFDANKPVNFKGTVTKMEWTNPHTWLHVDVKKADGTVESWAIEAGTPNVLFRRGFTKESLLPGTEIVITGIRRRTGRTARTAAT